MRFDPQAGFMPVEEDAPAPSEVRPGRPRRRAARWFLTSLVLSLVSVCVWKFALPVLAPNALQALSAPFATGEAGGAEMGSRLSQALKVMTGGDAADEAALPPRGPAFDLPMRVDEEALLAMIDATGAGETQAAVERDEADAHATLKMAEQLMARGKYGDAKSLLRNVRDHSPNDAQVRYKLGLACVMQRDYAGARAELKALRTLDPSLASLLSNLVPPS